jgi:hypothetical protein
VTHVVGGAHVGDAGVVVAGDGDEREGEPQAPRREGAVLDQALKVVDLLAEGRDLLGRSSCQTA